MTNLEQLGLIIKNFRETKKESQEKFAKRLGTNRTAIAHLEQGRKVPSQKILTQICDDLNIPKVFWTQFIETQHALRIEFETLLSELVGNNVSLDMLSEIEIEEAEKHINLLFENNNSEDQTFDNFNRCLIFYGIKKVSKDFFDHYLKSDAFNNIQKLRLSIIQYQHDAIRLFSTFSLAYEELNKKDSLHKYLSQLDTKKLDSYKSRDEWTCIEEIANKDLPFLGYIAAEKVAKESKERKKLIDFLKTVIEKFENDGKINTIKLKEVYDIKTLNQMDTLLRKFNSSIDHGLFSSLFDPDIDLIKREISKLAPKDRKEIIRMQEVQDKAFANLSNYLTADYMDLYIATSMRSDGDFISVNEFTKRLLEHDDLRSLKLRYFNPTQSWIEDRVAKGLVEALMLKRASITIYMAQKLDTFGKDSEASVSLGQGKPVIVYVPKLKIDEIGLDSEELSKLSNKDLSNLLETNDEDCTENNDCDTQALMSLVLDQYLNKMTDPVLINTVKKYWAEFDFESEVNRIKNDDKKIEAREKEEYRNFLDQIKKDEQILSISNSLKKHIIDIFIATTITFEKRAKIFKEVHPLALQVILSSGVLNGILVARSLNTCASLVSKLLENNLEFDLEIDDANYKLVEKTTGSIVRVISRNILLGHAFEQFYRN